MNYDQWLDEMTKAVREKLANDNPEPKCDTCNDTGRAMMMVCYGGLPMEKEADCPDCTGSTLGAIGPMEPLGAEFERVWDANADKLYER